MSDTESKINREFDTAMIETKQRIENYHEGLITHKELQYHLGEIFSRLHGEIAFIAVQ